MRGRDGDLRCAQRPLPSVTRPGRSGNLPEPVRRPRGPSRQLGASARPRARRRSALSELAQPALEALPGGGLGLVVVAARRGRAGCRCTRVQACACVASSSLAARRCLGRGGRWSSSAPSGRVLRCMVPLAVGHTAAGVARPRCTPSGARGVHTSAWTCSTAPLRPPSSSSSTPRPTACAGDACELTEVGAVLVGGGELHDRWESLVAVRAPLSRGDPALHRHLAGDGRRGAAGRGDAARARRAARRAACSSPTTRASTGACCARRSSARSSPWPDPPVAVHGRARAAASPRSRASASSPARRVARHRGRGRAPRAGRRRDVRARVLRAVRRGCARTRRRSATRSRCCARAPAARPRAPPTTARRRRARSRRGAARLLGAARRAGRLHRSATRRGRPLYVGKSVDGAHARALALRAVGAERAAGRRRRRSSTTARRSSELGALRAREPADQASCARRATSRSSTTTPTSTCAAASTSPFPVLEVAPEPAPGSRSTSGRCAAAPRRSSSRSSSTRCSALRHCGRKLPAPRAPVGLRADGPLPVAVPGRPRPEPLPPPARRGARRCSPAHGDGARRAARPRRRADARGRRASSATSARPGCAAATSGWRRCSSGSAARCARRTRARGSCSPAPGAEPPLRRVLARRRAASSTGARCPAPTTLERRTRRAAPRSGRARRRRDPGRGGGGHPRRRGLARPPPGRARARARRPPARDALWSFAYDDVSIEYSNQTLRSAPMRS